MTKNKYYDYLDRYNHMVCGNEYMYDTMDNIEYQYIKSSLLKHIKWQLKCAAYDMNTFNGYKQVLHKSRYKKIMRNIHDLKELHEKINEDKPIDIMYFTGTYRGAMSSIADDIFSGMKAVWIPIMILVVIYLVVVGIFYIM